MPISAYLLQNRDVVTFVIPSGRDCHQAPVLIQCDCTRGCRSGLRVKRERKTAGSREKDA